MLVLAGIELKGDQTWYRVRLPILPNNSTGWVRKSALGDLYTVDTHLYINRAKLTATLKRDGKVVFKTIVGVGTPSHPTPRGQFYVRDKLVGFDNPVYGPLAFGTSARSPTLTDWPGGGFIGVHGTNEPVAPARLRVARLHPHAERVDPEAVAADAVGTPITIG